MSTGPLEQDHREQLRQKNKSLNTWIAMSILLSVALVVVVVFQFIWDSLAL